MKGRGEVGEGEMLAKEGIREGGGGSVEGSLADRMFGGFWFYFLGKGRSSQGHRWKEYSLPGESGCGELG